MERHHAGETITQLAEDTGFHPDTVALAFRRLGVHTSRKLFTRDQTAEATILYAGGLSLGAIAEKLDVQPSTVYRRLKRAGVTMRDAHGR